MSEAKNKTVIFRMAASQYKGLAARAAFHNIPVAELIRQSIAAGLPAVLERYRQMTVEAEALRTFESERKVD